MSDEHRRSETLANIDALTLSISVRSLPRMIGSLLDTQLSIQQLKVLTSIVVSRRDSTSDLAAAFEVSLATMSKLVERLVEQGLVERRTDPEDQRIRRLHPTPLGRDVVARIMASRPEMGADILRGLTMNELTSLATGLRAINRELHAASADRD